MADQGNNGNAITESHATIKSQLAAIPGPLDISDAVIVWSFVTRVLWYTLSPFVNSAAPLAQQNSVLRLALVGGVPLSYLRLAYTESAPGGLGGSWVLQVTYENQTAVEYTALQIGFLPNGQIDPRTPASDLNDANRILAPVNASIAAGALRANITIDFWELINWMFVSQYWTGLLDFGQIEPVESNIFINETLFTQYRDYLHSTILPLLDLGLPSFNPLSSTNQLTANDTTLEVLYFCSDKSLKDATGLVISLIVADWAMIATAYALIRLLWKVRRMRQQMDHQERHTVGEHIKAELVSAKDEITQAISNL
jgi:hypothetical protein